MGRALAVLALLGTVMRADVAHAQPPRASESEVKAAYLYNFARFTEWPAPDPAVAPFAICVLGAEAFGSTIERVVSGLSVAGRQVATRQVSPADVGGCHMLFIAGSAEGDLGVILEAVRHHAILTVSDMPAFATRGGMIQFVIDGNRIRFDVNLASARGAGLTMRSELLRVARTVRQK